MQVKLEKKHNFLIFLTIWVVHDCQKLENRCSKDAKIFNIY